MVKKAVEKSKNDAEASKFEPTKMSFAVAAAAAAVLVLFGVIAIYL